MAKRGGLHPLAVWGVVRELANVAETQGPVAVGGARELAAALRRELARDALTGAVREDLVPGASVYVHVLAREPTDEDLETLRRARAERTPIVGVSADPDFDRPLPFVLATDVVRVPSGSGFPIDEIGRAVARAIGEDASDVAARVPSIRNAVCDVLIERFARTNGVAGAAVFVPGADLPVLTLNQVRLVLRIGAAHGVPVDRERLPEIMGVVGSGLALRAVARQLVASVPLAGWAVKGAIAYTGTRAVGEAARAYFARRAGGSRRAGEGAVPS